MKQVMIQIGNSDDKLSQKRWSEFFIDVHATAAYRASRVYGVWVSDAVAEFQNCCWFIEISDHDFDRLLEELDVHRLKYEQDSIAVSIIEKTIMVGEKTEL